ncbi:hypothetical protein Lesp02_39430 [Lentzea sp. NBRC 105346]|uniref:hypothetical protein n=1 Tax=Lentzea sp. NBRC 105346 TaxID=3032205 RepID=UPI00249FA7F4|nr:hypothetical protein [Lentzea sp. NBRC 105346]GLZ31755.1 hypothetical protein Lesp02_39430 [Lentzea sp. NBRC 105346]
MAELLFAGAQRNVTPPAGFPLGGYVARGLNGATHSHDALEVSALWLGTADEPGVLWLCLDSLAVDAELTQRLKERATARLGIPAEHVVVCASHTHAAPLGWTCRLHPGIPGGRDDDLVAALVGTADEALRALPAARHPVTLSWCEAPASGVGTNRHSPDGPHDNTTGVLAIKGNEGTIDGLLFDFASHPTVLGPENLAWSADWPGAARTALSSALSATVGFLQGAAGDASPRFTRRGRGHGEVSRIGALLADTILTALVDRSRPLPSIAPRVFRSTVSLPVREVPDAVPLCAEQTFPDTPAGRISQTNAEGARALAQLVDVDLPTTMELPVSVVTLGDVAWVHLPVELFGSLGLRIRAASPFPVTRVAGYSDGYFGYVADADGHERQVYEAMISLFDAPAADLLLAHIAGLLKRARTGP